ncbi:MAG: 1-(5-phosphoribosyl)-5-[(5-phosphoribosylamino)methylideneamino] imidazole-4-carboxamide isomerase [Anaerolineales bacterium]|nr:1-(5-phosphoribosyl)-5-[(5-phosphoribosylamino)methylideneamino] imidazole-4-carboxamide isomerase [Anaerolineales bacterium]
MTADTFTIFPAIDLRAGKVVRLAQGDPDRQTIYSDDPGATARRWLDEGARWLHIINLDGAFGASDSANQRVLAEILEVAGRYNASVEFGGGMREEDAIRAALEMGVERVFLGTATIKNPELVARAVATYGSQRIAGDIGARDSRVTVSGWQEATGLGVLEVGRRLRQLGLEWCVLTDVRRDGVGIGVDVHSAAELQSASGLKVVASGGVASLDDVRRAQITGLAGIIIGRALYEGQLSLQECLKAVHS